MTKDQRISSTEYHEKVKKSFSKRSKWKNKPTEYNGRTYHSKKEADYARKLDQLKHAGEILSWTSQVRFDLPGNAKHYIDFMVFYHDKTYKLVEIKGRDLPLGKLKRKQVEELYGVEVEVK